MKYLQYTFFIVVLSTVGICVAANENLKGYERELPTQKLNGHHSYEWPNGDMYEGE